MNINLAFYEPLKYGKKNLSASSSRFKQYKSINTQHVEEYLLLFMYMLINTEIMSRNK